MTQTITLIEFRGEIGAWQSKLQPSPIKKIVSYILWNKTSIVHSTSTNFCSILSPDDLEIEIEFLNSFCV